MPIYLPNHRRSFRMPYGDIGKVAHSPDFYSSLYWWIDATSGVYKDGGVTLAANGETVQQWNDKGPNSYNLTQATAGNRPTYTTNVINGLPAVSFNGTSSVMEQASLNVGNNGTLFAVIKPSSTSPVGLFDSGPSNANVLRNYSGGYFEWHNESPKLSLGLANTNAVLLEIFWSYTPQRVMLYHKNGATPATASGGGGTAAAGMFWGNTPKLGNINNGGGGWYSGYVGEFVFYNAALTEAQRVYLRNYFNLKWAIY